MVLGGSGRLEGEKVPKAFVAIGSWDLAKGPSIHRDEAVAGGHQA